MKTILLLLMIGCETPTAPPVVPDDIPANRITFITEWLIVDTVLIVIPKYAMMPGSVTSSTMHIEVITAGKITYNGAFNFGAQQYEIPWKHRTQVQLATAYIIKTNER